MEFHPSGAGAILPAVMVFPGGAYSHRADHEGACVAEEFNKRGFHSFVVHYRVAPDRYPAPFLDAVAAVRHVRNNADEYGVRRDGIAVCGFSAGGHLAASLGIFKGDDDAGIPGKLLESSRPDAMILCYPVISFEKYTHEGSVRNLLGECVTPQARRKFSWFRHVEKKTPPAFLWHTSDDSAVPVQNSLLLANALRRNSIPFELHVFPSGPHGLGLAKQNPRISQWTELASGWLGELLQRKGK